MAITPELTPCMKKALMQIGYGVFASVDGYYDESNERLDLRSADALRRRGLVVYSLQGGSSFLRGRIQLTEAGDRILDSDNS